MVEDAVAAGAPKGLESSAAVPVIFFLISWIFSEISQRIITPAAVRNASKELRTREVRPEMKLYFMLEIAEITIAIAPAIRTIMQMFFVSFVQNIISTSIS